MRSGWTFVMSGLLSFFSLSGCDSPEERVERLKAQEAALQQQLESLPGYNAAIDEGIAAKAADSGMELEQREQLQEKLGDWDRRKVKDGLRRLCLNAGKVLATDKKVNLQEGGVPASSPKLLELLGTPGFRDTCTQLWEIKQQLQKG